MDFIKSVFNLIQVYILQLLRLLLNIYSKYCERKQKGRIPPITDELLLKPAVVIASNIRRGKIKCKDVLEAYLKRIDQVDPLIKAVVEINRKATEDAEAIDEKVRLELEGHEPTDGVSINDMPLIGVPVSVKDVIGVKGLLFTCGLYERRNTVAIDDSDIVANLRKAGAIPIVKSSTPEFLPSYDTDNTIVGYTNNPYDLSRSPGGSSGGECALLTTAASVIGIGTDLGGSVRIPGLFCGVFGHKPSAILSNNGILPEKKDAMEKYFVSGPMCRFAVDLIPTLKAMAGEDISKLPLIDTEVDLNKIRIFYSYDDKDPLKTKLDTQIKQCIKKVVTHFEGKYNIECVEVHFEEFSVANDIWRKVVAKQMTTEYQTYLHGANVFLEFIKSMFGVSRHTTRSLFFAIVSKFLDYKITDDEKAAIKRLKKKYKNLLGENGVFISPTHPVTSPKRPLTIINLMDCGYTIPQNILQVPSTHCPMGLNKQGLPIGLQVSAAANNDHLTIAVAKEIESAFFGWVPPCEITC